MLLVHCTVVCALRLPFFYCISSTFFLWNFILFFKTFSDTFFYLQFLSSSCTFLILLSLTLSFYLWNFLYFLNTLYFPWNFIFLTSSIPCHFIFFTKTLSLIPSVLSSPSNVYIFLTLPCRFWHLLFFFDFPFCPWNVLSLT